MLLSLLATFRYHIRPPASYLVPKPTSPLISRLPSLPPLVCGCCLQLLTFATSCRPPPPSLVADCRDIVALPFSVCLCDHICIPVPLCRHCHQPVAQSLPSRSNRIAINRSRRHCNQPVASSAPPLIAPSSLVLMPSYCHCCLVFVRAWAVISLSQQLIYRSTDEQIFRTLSFVFFICVCVRGNIFYRNVLCGP